jgi:outer membrane protein assembly factor BamB
MRRRVIGLFVILMIVWSHSSLRATDGDIEWTFQSSGELGAAAIAPGGAIYVTDYGGVLYSLDPESGTQNWSW